MEKTRLRKFIPDFAIHLAQNVFFKIYKTTGKIFLKGIFDKYDFQTRLIIEKKLNKNSNWVDVGANRGDILKELLAAAPGGKSYAFEPIPDLYKKLQAKYGDKVSVKDIALSNEKGEKKFVYFKDRPAVSGFNKRNFEKHYVTEDIIVQVDKLDNIIDPAIKIDFIKIDVEGAEMQVMKGAENIIHKNKPIILFEFGLGGSDLYETTPEMMYDFLTGCGLVVSLLESFIKKQKPLTREGFVEQFNKGINYYFMAYNPLSISR